MNREELEPRLIHLIAGLRRHQVEEAVFLLLNYIDAKADRSSLKPADLADQVLQAKE